MSHRKTTANHLSSKAESLESAAASAYTWSFTRRILRTHVSALELSQNSLLGPDEFFKLLENIDLTESLHTKLDRDKIANIPINVRDQFLRQYLSACITGMAENQGVLVPLKGSALVSFPNPAQGQQTGTPVPAPPKPEDGSYISINPATAPFESQIPCFHGTFLGMLQTRLQKLLKTKGIYPTDADNEVELDALMELAFDKITEERMFGECRAATTEYFRLLLGEKEPAAVTVVSKTGGPFVFLWLMSSGLLDDMIISLLGGTPLMQAKEPAGPYGNIHFEPTDFGNKVGLWKLDPEAK